MFFLNKHIKKYITATTLMASAVMMTSPSVQAESVDLEIVGAWDFLSQYKKFEGPFWSEKISKLSNGEINAKIEGFNKRGLSGREIIRLLSLGEVDFGTTVAAYDTDSDPIAEGFDLAGLAPEVGTSRQAVEAFLPILDQYYQDKHGIKILAAWPYPAQVIYCVDPLTSISDLKGRVVRAGTRSMSELVESLGATSVNVPFGKIRSALSDGTVSCAITGSLPGNAVKLYEPANYQYPLALSWAMAIHGANIDVWEDLEPKHQKIIQDGLTEMADGLWKNAAFETEQGILCNTGQDGCTAGKAADMTLVNVTDTDRQLVQDLMHNVVTKRWSDRCGTECVDSWNKTIGPVVKFEIK